NVTTETYDPEGAKKVLEDAGWTDSDGDGIREKDGQKLTIRWLTYPSRQELPLLAESAQATLKEIGMDVQINCTADNNTIRKDTSLWDVYASAMVTAPTGDPEYFFTSCCLDSSAVNNGKYHSDELEKLAAEMAVTFDPEKRGELAIQMQQTILDDNAYVFCSHLRMSMISSSKVTGLTAHPCDYYEITADLDIEM
ncbi:MAG: ABC transporter substrate-binding protein, partial [Lachnospiraceae bacterium]